MGFLWLLWKLSDFVLKTLFLCFICDFYSLLPIPNIEWIGSMLNFSKGMVVAYDMEMDEHYELKGKYKQQRRT
jgi:hypothetical protein